MFSWLRSLGLTISLLLVLAFLLGLSTFIPQQTESSLEWINWLKLNRMFQSPLFTLPLGLFTLNLLSCSLYRISREIRQKKFSPGPDLIHLGLLILLGGLLFSGIAVRESLVWVEEGNTFDFPGGRRFTVTDIRREYDANGNLINWVTELDKTEDISVNHPFKQGHYLLFQYSRDASGPASALALVYDPGYRFFLPGMLLMLTGFLVHHLHSRRKGK